MTSYVYCATNLINGKRYVGKARNINRRKTTHKYHALKLQSNSAFYNAIRKYGFENFVWEEFGCFLTDEEAEQMEIQKVKELDTLVPNGYNMCLGGRGNTSKRTPEQLQFLAEMRSRTKPPSCKGIPKSPEHRAKIGASMRGIPKTSSHKQNMRKPKRKHDKQILHQRSSGERTDPSYRI